jgi:hypothetical protein
MNNNDINLENKRKNKGELLNVLKMYSPAVIALKDIFFTEKKEKKQKSESYNKKIL